MDQNILFGGGDPCLCDIEQLAGEPGKEKALDMASGVWYSKSSCFSIEQDLSCRENTVDF